MVLKLFSSIVEISISMLPVILILWLIAKPIIKIYSVNWRLNAFIIIALRMLIPYNLSLSGVPLEIRFASSAWVYYALALIWLLGMIVTAICMAVQYFSFRYAIKRSGIACTDERVLTCLRKARFNTGIVDIKPRVYLCPFVYSPMAVGIISRRVLLPSYDYKDEDLESIFRHELVHCWRFDVLRKLLMLLVCVIHWFNPIVWIMAKEMSMDIELACDTAVVARSGEGYRISYGQTILNSIAHELKCRKNIQYKSVPLASASLNGKKSFLQRRIKNIVAVKKEQGGMFALCMFFMLVSLLSILVTFSI